jgi:hypothetical protein
MCRRMLLITSERLSEGVTQFPSLFVNFLQRLEQIRNRPAAPCLEQTGRLLDVGAVTKERSFRKRRVVCSRRAYKSLERASSFH